jgi:hypothetical protein
VPAYQNTFSLFLSFYANPNAVHSFFDEKSHQSKRKAFFLRCKAMQIQAEAILSPMQSRTNPSKSYFFSGVKPHQSYYLIKKKYNYLLK